MSVIRTPTSMLRPTFDGLTPGTAGSQAPTPRLAADPGYFDQQVVAQYTDTINLPGASGPPDVFGVGLTGVCRPGQMLVVGPIGQLATVQALANGNGLSVFPYASPLEIAILRGGALPVGCFVLRPGDVVRFDAPIAGGGLFALSIIAGAVKANNGNIYYNMFDVAPRYSVVRWFTRDPGEVANLNYIRGAFSFDYQLNGLTVASPVDGVVLQPSALVKPIPHGTRNVMLHFLEKSASAPPVSPYKRYNQGSPSYFDVAWMPPSGFLAHNQADDFDDAGRGPVTAAHDCEVYAVPSWALGIYISQNATLPTSALAVVVTCTE